MIEFRLSLDALGNTRFGYSPLGELASSLRALGNPYARGVLRPWLRDVAGSIESVDFRLLQAVAPPGYVAPDFLFSWSTDPQTTIADQMQQLLTLPAEVVAEQLRETWAGRTPPSVLRPLLNGEGREALCDALVAYWEAAIGRYWSRIRSVIDDDIAYRVNRLMAGGLYGLLRDLHHEVSVSGDILAIDKPQHPDAAFETPMITLIPSVFVWPQLIVAHSAPDCFELQYGARGVGRVWEGMDEPAETKDALSALVGRTRAAIMAKLGTPHSTTQLALVLGASPANVSSHLSVLRRSGLVSATRRGRSVLYRRTALATSILAATDQPGIRQDLA